MTVKELLKNETYSDYEVYTSPFGKKSFHTDNIRFYEEDYLDKDVKSYCVMDEEEYDSTILANSCTKADFKEWYDDEKATVLCILV